MGCGFPETTLPLVGAELTWAQGCCFQDHPRSQFQILQTNQVFGSLKSKLIRLLPGSVRKTGQLHNHQGRSSGPDMAYQMLSKLWLMVGNHLRQVMGFVPVSNINRFTMVTIQLCHSGEIHLSQDRSSSDWMNRIASIVVKSPILNIAMI